MTFHISEIRFGNNGSSHVRSGSTYAGSLKIRQGRIRVVLKTIIIIIGLHQGYCEKWHNCGGGIIFLPANVRILS